MPIRHGANFSSRYITLLQLPANNHAAISVKAVDLEHRLRDVKTDCLDRLHVWLLLVVEASKALTSSIKSGTGELPEPRERPMWRVRCPSMESPRLERKRSEKKVQLVRFGEREIETLGLSQGFWSDLYHRSMTVQWPVFFGIAAALFVPLNTVFGFLYSLGHAPVANAAANGPLAYFYFSVETLATVGYGNMHPQSNYGHLIATIEIFTGMCFLAVMTGVIFARFSRPRGRFVFANNAVITRHEGRQTLIIRMANARHNTISRANARLWITRVERTREGEQLRRFYELKLDRSDHPIFVLSWNLFHFIDEDSLLHGLTASDLTQGDALLVLNVGGVDDNSTQQLYARHVYSWRDIRWQHRYEDITSVSRQGRLLLDYTKFHVTVPEQ